MTMSRLQVEREVLIPNPIARGSAPGTGTVKISHTLQGHNSSSIQSQKKRQALMLFMRDCALTERLIIDRHRLQGRCPWLWNFWDY
jgi:hypothetical protein